MQTVEFFSGTGFASSLPLMSSWEDEEHLKKELKEVASKKPPISARQVGNITKLAIKNVKVT